MDSVFLSVRIPNELAARLAALKERTHEPTSSFVKRCIEEGLTGEGGVCELDVLKAELHRLGMPGY